jgi:hypothetical protein
MFKKQSYCSKYIYTSLQTTLAAEAHLAEGQFLLEERLNTEKSVIFREGTRSPTVSKIEGQNLEQH